MIRGLLSPKKLTEVDFSDIIRTLTSHYSPKKNAIVERFHFNTCNKKSGQSVTDYIAELKELSRFCDFGISEGELTPQLVLEENLRDRFVCGLGPGSGPQPVGRGPVTVRRPIGTGPRKKYSLEI